MPRTLAENLLIEGVPYRVGTGLGPGVVDGARGTGGSWSFRTGESERGREVLGLLLVGLWALPGPTDLLNIDKDGVGGV